MPALTAQHGAALAELLDADEAAGVHVVWCDGHAAPATREVWWIEHPSTRDEHGQATPVCPDDHCLARVLADIADHGGHVQQVGQL
jgi:prepilin-type processing-associated H-X9-DG protein